MAGNWEIFVRWHRDEVVGVVLHTPLYNFIAENFPLQFIAKLISTVLSSADYTTIISAAAIIQDVAGTSAFEENLNSTTITGETIEYFRRSALYFMVNDFGIIPLQTCGKVLTSKLLCWALELDVEWNEFLQLARRGFFAAEYALLNLILDIICDQPYQMARDFMSFLESSITENYSIFFDVMIVLLGAGNDHRPYCILAYVCGMLTDEQWSILMEVAIVFSLFDDVHSSSSRVSAALALRFCIDNGPEIHYSFFMICKLQAIIICLRSSMEPLEMQAGEELFEAFARRVSNAPIPWRH